MALKLYWQGIQPLGSFTLKDSVTVSGGEVGVLESTGTNANGFQVVVVRKAIPDDVGPFYLMDDGKGGYGLNFGNVVIRSNTGFELGVDAATKYGPPSYAGSAKVTLWDKPGIYAVTLDCLADDETVLKAVAPGTGLTVDLDGKLTVVGAVGSPVASVVQFVNDESLVTTGGSVNGQKKLIINFNPFGNVK